MEKKKINIKYSLETIRKIFQTQKYKKTGLFVIT